MVSVLPFSDEDEAVRAREGHRLQPRCGAVWTNDVGRAPPHVRSARCRNSGWTDTYGPTDARLPWGGMGGQSGIGPRPRARGARQLHGTEGDLASARGLISSYQDARRGADC